MLHPYIEVTYEIKNQKPLELNSVGQVFYFKNNCWI